ncbi:Uncharacterized protein FWK35_00031671, partial [Aphis craccivora]
MARRDLILDSERSDKCIDFTMFITSRNNASISNFGGGFRCKIFKKIEKNKKKKAEKREFLRKTSFRLNRFFLWLFENLIQVQIFTKSVENAKICNISRRYLNILP